MSASELEAKLSELLAVAWTENNTIRMLDQRELPAKMTYIECKNVEDVHQAIFDMTIRGAPAIGAAGAYGMALAAVNTASACGDNMAEFVEKLAATKKYLDSARPTAVNLEWATGRIMELVQLLHTRTNPTKLAELILREAKEVADQDREINRRLGDYGAKIVPNKANILHHCNTGALATIGRGTALGVIYTAFEQGKDVHVWVDETRPRLQGAKLTTFELMHAGVPLHLIPDNAAGLLMYQGKVDLIVFGADRVAANGDVANKVGTMKVAICGKEMGVPVYACVPTPTIDLNIASGRDIVIEERSPEEVVVVGSTRLAPEGCPVFNPAFDVTPAKYLTGIITEEGICYPPFEKSLAEAKARAEARTREAWERTLKELSAEVSQEGSKQ